MTCLEIVHRYSVLAPSSITFSLIDLSIIFQPDVLAERLGYVFLSICYYYLGHLILL